MNLQWQKMKLQVGAMNLLTFSSTLQLSWFISNNSYTNLHESGWFGDSLCFCCCNLEKVHVLCLLTCKTYKRFFFYIFKQYKKQKKVLKLGQRTKTSCFFIVLPLDTVTVHLSMFFFRSKQMLRRRSRCLASCWPRSTSCWHSYEH